MSAEAAVAAHINTMVALKTVKKLLFIGICFLSLPGSYEATPEYYRLLHSSPSRALVYDRRCT